MTRGKSGRIRSAADAEHLLGDDRPNQLLGQSPSVSVSDVSAIPVEDPDEPEVVADFAARIMLTRDRGTLRERRPGDRTRRAAAANLWWITWGPIVRASDGGLAIGSLSIAPHRRSAEEQGDVALGVTGEMLRVIAPAKILADAVAYLRRTAHWLGAAESLGHPPAPEAQKRALSRVTAARTRPARVSDDELAAIAARYVQLFTRGVRRPLPQLAAEFGLNHAQARDRVYRARQKDYLSSGTQGKAGGEPGPRLLERQQSDPSDPRGSKPRRRKGENDG